MYAVVQINLSTGEMRGFGPYQDKRNANTAVVLYKADQYHTTVIRLRPGRGFRWDETP